MCDLELCFLFSPAVEAGNQSGLIGTWQAQTPQGQLVLIIKSESLLIYDGAQARFTLIPGELLVMTDAGTATYPYNLKGDVLEIRYPEGFTLPFKRLTAAGRQTHARQDDRLSQLLLSSAWCSFSFSGGSQYSRTSSSRVRFSPNGTYSYKSSSESHFAGRDTSDGYNRSDGSAFGSQNNAGADGRWQVRYGRLFMSEGNGSMEEIGLEVTRNSNGYPILQSEGIEYSQCN